MVRLCIAFLAVLAAASGGGAADGEARLPLPLELVVEAGERERVDALVQFPLSWPTDGQPLRLTETTGGKQTPVPVQVDAGTNRLWWIAEGSIAAGGKRTYRLQAGPASGAAPVEIIDSDRAVEARFDSKPLLKYNKAHVAPPAGANPRYGRSAHLHPVQTPRGAVVTDEFPPDHLHQSGIFLAYTKAEFEGRDVDFWNLAGGKGRVRFKELIRTVSGPVFGEFAVLHEHVDLTGVDPPAIGDQPEQGKVALLETWHVRIWPAGWESGYWLLDIASSQRCAGDSPLRLPEYHYGGMAIRGARGWTPENVQFLTSEGDNRLQGNHTRPRWCCMTGLVGGHAAGVTFMTCPSNFRFPEPLRIHPTMPYMVYTPSFLGDWEIRPAPSSPRSSGNQLERSPALPPSEGQREASYPHQARYRFVIHDGELPAHAADRLWHDFAHPLLATTK